MSLTAIFLPLALLLILLLIGVPVAFSMSAAAFVGLVLVGGFDAAISVFQNDPVRQSMSFTLTTVPLFILMAEFLSNGRLVKEIYASAVAWLGKLRGGLAMATVTANAGFAVLSGSSTAAVASMARITVPEMRKAGYSEKLSLGTVAASGTLAAIIPPSGALIIYGALTETSIAQLFIAGIVPGLATAIGYLIVVYIWSIIDPAAAPKITLDGKINVWRERFVSLIKIWPALLLIALLLLGIYSGAVTPTEAGAVGAFGGFLISVLFGGLRMTGIVAAVKNTLKTTSMIFLLIIAAGLFGSYLTMSQITQNTITWISSLGVAPIVVVIAVAIIYLVLGTMMDAIAMMVLTLPLTFPLMIEIGYDAVWFGILVIKLAEIGLITPPFGLNVFVTVGSIKSKIGDAFSGASRFLSVEIVLVVLLIIFPAFGMLFIEEMR